MKTHLVLAASIVLLLSPPPAAGQDSLDRLKGTVDATTKQSGVCPVHDVRMLKRTVEITYGLPAASTPPPSRDKRARDFPFGEPQYLGGCVVSDDSPKYAVVYACPRCESALKLWVKAHTKS